MAHFIAAVFRQLPTGRRIEFPPRSLWSRSIRTNFHGPCSGRRAALAATLQTKPAVANIKGSAASSPRRFLRLSASLSVKMLQVRGEGKVIVQPVDCGGGRIVDPCDLCPLFPNTGGFYTRGFFISASSRNWEFQLKNW